MDGKRSNSILRSIAARRCTSLHIMRAGVECRGTSRINRRLSGSRNKSSETCQMTPTPSKRWPRPSWKVSWQRGAYSVDSAQPEKAKADAGSAKIRSTEAALRGLGDSSVSPMPLNRATCLSREGCLLFGRFGWVYVSLLVATNEAALPQ
jgi:hypothetical protein